MRLALFCKIVLLCAWDNLVDKFVTRCPGTLVIDLDKQNACIVHEEGE